MKTFACLLCAVATVLPATLRAQTRGTDLAEFGLRRTVVVDVVQKTKDAVVNISTTRLVNQRMGRFGNDPFWQHFDVGDVVKVPADSLGSGFVIHADGYVITNHHVIDRAREITVELNDGRKLPAELISSDADADLAVLRIRSDKPLPALDLGDSGDLLIGEPVIAVGNPMGYSHSVSTGIVSAVHRDLKDARGGVMLGDLIQTDAAINPGNSGGPLLNAYGQVIGINTAIRGDAQNIGFAIPVNKLRDLIPELMDPAQVNKVQLGLRLKEQRTLTPPATVECAVGKADGGAPLVALNGHKPANIVDAYAVLLRVKADEKVKLEFDQGAPETLMTKALPPPETIVQAHKRLGLTVAQLTPMLAQKQNLSAEDGLLVSEVLRGSVAERAGVQPGDVIVQLGRYRVSKLDDLGSLLQHLPDHGRVRVGVIRGNQLGFGVLEF